VNKKTGLSISFIGAGNVAHHLALNFYANGVKIKEIYNRSSKAGLTLADKVNAAYIDTISDLQPADIIIIAVSDSYIRSISESINLNGGANTIITHTSGSQPLSVLKRHEHRAVFYPLQSFRKELDLDISSVPILISAESEEISNRLIEIGNIISHNVIRISDDDRSLLHLPAVMVNNFTNHILQLAYEYCDGHNLDFSLLQPLIKETVTRLENNLAPRDMQTGPALRGDEATLNRHEKQLEAHPIVLSLYQFMTEQIKKYYE